MITINNLTMGFTQRTLFKGVSFSIFRNEKIGLAGPNGSGKTTLFSILLGKMEPVSGYVQIQKNISIGFLPQEFHFKSDRTVIEELTQGDDRIKKLTDEKRRLEDANMADTLRYGDVLHDLEQLGIYELEHRAEKILSGLGFKPEDSDRPVSELSGGWQMRTLLAKLLTCPYDLLLLDEPTNYLDLSATLWLKDFLSSYRGSFVIISHDRVFLNDVTNYTIMLENASVVKVKGNYDIYEHQKEVNLKSLEKRQKVIEKRRQQLERFVQRFHAQPNRASAAYSKRKMIGRMEKIELPREHKSIGSFNFSQTNTSGYVVVRTENLKKSFDDKQIYSGLDFEVTREQKICLVGPNGAGKSTLLKMLAGVLKPDGGKLKYGHNVEVGYFSQTRMDVLNPDRTAFDEVASAATGGIPALRVRSLLGTFNFHGDDVFKQVRVLSGGEKSRLILARLLINPPNFLLLDEPTTHLDIDGVNALTEAFKEYNGTLCFISHDLFFIRNVADSIAEISDGTLKIYPGGLGYYLEKKRSSDVLLKEENKQIKIKRKKLENVKKISAKALKSKESLAITELHQKHKKALKRIAGIKVEIKNLQVEQKELETESYVKARLLSKSFNNREQETIKEYGRRLKFIPKRMRDIESEINRLKEEKERISR